MSVTLPRPLRTVLQLPGQLSEHPGMLDVVREAWPEGDRLLEQAESVTGLPLGRLMTEGPEDALQQDRTAAAAMVTANVMTHHALTSCWDVDVTAVAGHSVGFTSALVVAGVLDFADALEVVLSVDAAIETERQEPGAMGVVVGLGEEAVADLARRAGCDVACINAATQIAVSGSPGDVDALLEMARDSDALTARRMPMGKPMHSRHLRSASQRLRRELSGLRVKPPRLTLFSHLDGALIRTGEEARELLAVQISERVGWRHTVQSMWDHGRAAGATCLLECGPGDVLTRLARWIDRSIPARALSERTWWERVGESANA